MSNKLLWKQMTFPVCREPHEVSGFFQLCLCLQTECNKNIFERCLLPGICYLQQHLPHCTKKRRLIVIQTPVQPSFVGSGQFFSWPRCTQLGLLCFPILNRPYVTSQHSGGTSEYQTLQGCVWVQRISEELHSLFYRIKVPKVVNPRFIKFSYSMKKTVL